MPQSAVFTSTVTLLLLMTAMKKGANAPTDAAETAALPLRVPVTLLSPLTPMKKGADALYIGVLAPCHP